MSGSVLFTSEKVTRQDGSELVIYWFVGKDKLDKTGVAFEGDAFNIANQSAAESLMFAAELGAQLVDNVVKEELP